MGRDRDGSNNLIADDTRNIVLVHNTIAHPNLSGSTANQGNINGLVVGNTFFYGSLYDALKVGVADTAEQDIYVFAAEDGRTNDVGVLASIPAAQEDHDNDGNTPVVRLLEDYSIVVVAAGAGSRTPCGSVVAAFCIAAPGAYHYIDKESGSDNMAYDDTDDLVAGSVTANAAASLVAGGLAVLESIFGDPIDQQPTH